MVNYVIKCLVWISAYVLVYQAHAQVKFSKADSLLGGLRHQRTAYDVKYYDLSVTVLPPQKKIEGVCVMVFETVDTVSVIQVDLASNLSLKRAVWKGKPLHFKREFNAIWIQFPEVLKKGLTESISMEYDGMPAIAKNPPWDEGLVFKWDSNKKPWVGVACEGRGAHIWWPTKDDLSDEPDSMAVHLTVPAGLMGVSNGNLVHTQHQKKTSTYSWKVSYPINNYNVTFYIGDFVFWTDTFSSATQTLPLRYYVLRENLEKSKSHFEQVKPMLACYEQKLGPYPFPRDGFALVDAPYLGMEHQSAIAYGNQYLPGYLGMDLSAQNLPFDYIIIHETGHEYWGNNVSMRDIADMWIHESFCTYSELIIVECLYGIEKAARYAQSWKLFIENSQPIIGQFGVRHQTGTDMYYKGAYMLYTLQKAVNDDTKWWNCLRSIQQTFQYQTISGSELIAFMNQQLGADYTPFFLHYLTQTTIPVLNHRIVRENNQVYLEAKWDGVAPEFFLPVRFYYAKNDFETVTVTGLTQRFPLKAETISVQIDETRGYYTVKYE